MKKLCTALMLFGSGSLLAQPFGNEWINYAAPYIKLTADKGNGIYRITKTELGNKIDDGISSSTLKVYFRGRQIPITVEDGGDGVFDNNDYIEFYGIFNDAFLDKQMYDNPADHPNPYANIYENRSHYFLSWGGENGLRTPVVESTNFDTAVVAYVWGETVQPFDETMIPGEELAGQYYRFVTYSHFYTNKGRASNLLHNNGIRTINLPYQHYQSQSGVSAKIEVLINGLRFWNQTARLSLRGTVIKDTTFSGYTNVLWRQEVSHSYLSAASPLPVSIHNVSTQGGTSFSIAYLRLVYPQQPIDQNLARQFFLMPKDPQGISTLRWKSERTGLKFYDVTSPYYVKEIKAYYESGYYTLVIDSTEAQRRIMVSGEVLSFGNAVRLELTAPQTDVDYIILTDERLRRKLGDTLDVVQAYADYRASQAGGAHKVAIAHVNDIYNQFGYGEMHPLAIRRYLAYLLSKGKPEYLFIIGQGFRATQNYGKSPVVCWNNTSLVHYVPGYGFPESDAAFSAGLLPGKSMFEPAIATGRLPVQQPQQILDYLLKVIQHDTASYLRAGKNRIIHLAGGNNSFEINAIASFMATSARSAETGYVGADVETIVKTTTQFNQGVNISRQINEGIALLDVFAHGSLTNSQMDFGRPNYVDLGYQNQGKYFGLFFWGCAAGNSFACTAPWQVPIMADWVLAPQKGAILGYSHSTDGYLVDLGRMQNSLYANYFEDSVLFKQAFGKFLVEWSSRYYNSGASVLSKVALQQFILFGDPAVHLLTNPKADYSIANARVKYQTPGNIPLTAQLDTFEIVLPIQNLGTYDPTTLYVRVEREFGNGAKKVYPFEAVRPFVNEQKLIIKITQSLSEKAIAPGINKFTITLDPDTLISELSRTNNTLVLSLPLPKGTVQLLSPSPFAIVTSRRLTFYAIDNDIRENRIKTYFIDTDTIPDFNSPLKQTYTTTGFYTIQKTIDLQVADSTVVYWRVRVEGDSAADIVDEVQSFILIDGGHRGWSQSHFPQFKSIETSPTLLRNDTLRWWNLDSREMIMEVVSRGFRHPDSGGYYVKINGETFFERRAAQLCTLNAIGIAAISRKTFKPYMRGFPNFGFTLLYCGNTSQFSYFWNEYLAQGYNFSAFRNLYNGYETGDFIIMLSTLNFDHADAPYGRYLRDLSLMGIDEAEYLQKAKKGWPFIAFSRKTVPQQPAQVFYADPNSPIPPIRQELKATFNLGVLSDTSGTLTSPVIGPSLKWKHLYYQFEGRDSGADSVRVEIWGIDRLGTKELLISDAPNGLMLDSLIDARKYPQLFLQAHLMDSDLKTPLQLKYWRVLFEQYPEGVLAHDNKENPDLKPSLMQGDKVSFGFKFSNISDEDFVDSLKVEYVLEEERTGRRKRLIQKIPQVAAGDSVGFRFEYRLGLDMFGKILMQVFVNPFEQPELSYANNSLERTFFVRRDTINPTLDVSFDGAYIANGDYVSAEPLIAIKLRDESKFFIYQDTSYLEVYLSPCPDCEPAKVYFSDPELVRYSFDKPNGISLELTPRFEKEGVYTLRVVGYDVSGNRVSTIPYEISFRVAFANGASYFYAYPNPFSSTLYFDFVLRGADEPDEIWVEIFSSTGQKVNSLSLLDTRDIRIGRNERILAWDGRNAAGARLSPGLYFYQVRLRSKNGEYSLLPIPFGQHLNYGRGKIILLNP